MVSAAGAHGPTRTDAARTDLNSSAASDSMSGRGIGIGTSHAGSAGSADTCAVFRSGMDVDVLDTVDKWCEGRVVCVQRGRQVLVHYHGWYGWQPREHW